MSDADDARSAKALGELAHHAKELVKVMETINKNFVVLVRACVVFADRYPLTKEQNPFGEQQEESEKAQPLDAAIQEALRQKSLKDFHPNQIVYVPMLMNYGKVTVVGVERYGYLAVEVEMNGTEDKLLFAPNQLEIPKER